MYSYIASGSLTLKNCASVTVFYNFPHLYSIGDRVWLKYKNLLGVLESVVIKKINRTEIHSKQTAVFNYVDTFNRVWLEHELIGTEEEAAILVSNYFEELFEKQQQLIC